MNLSSNAITDAHAALHEHRYLFEKLVNYFRNENSETGRRIAGALNSEIKDILLSSFVCEFVLREIKFAIAAGIF